MHILITGFGLAGELLPKAILFVSGPRTSYNLYIIMSHNWWVFITIALWIRFAQDFILF